MVWQLSQETSHFRSPASTYSSLFFSASGSRILLPFFLHDFACTEDYSSLLLSKNIEFKSKTPQPILCSSLLLPLPGSKPQSHISIYVVGVGFGRIASAIQGSGSSSVRPYKMAFSRGFAMQECTKSATALENRGESKEYKYYKRCFVSTTGDKEHGINLASSARRGLTPCFVADRRNIIISPCDGGNTDGDECGAIRSEKTRAQTTDP